MYQQLAKRGYHYAKWVYGVASADSITGNDALEFIQSVAKEHNHTLTTDETNNVDINYWTLYEPMHLIERYASAKLPNEQVVTGKDIVELMWEHMWKTGGTSIKSLDCSYELFNIVKDIKKSTPIKKIIKCIASI